MMYKASKKSYIFLAIEHQIDGVNFHLVYQPVLLRLLKADNIVFNFCRRLYFSLWRLRRDDSKLFFKLRFLVEFDKSVRICIHRLNRLLPIRL